MSITRIIRTQVTRQSTRRLIITTNLVNRTRRPSNPTPGSSTKRNQLLRRRRHIRQIAIGPRNIVSRTMIIQVTHKHRRRTIRSSPVNYIVRLMLVTTTQKGLSNSIRLRKYRNTSYTSFIACYIINNATRTIPTTRNVNQNNFASTT